MVVEVWNDFLQRRKQVASSCLNLLFIIVITKLFSDFPKQRVHGFSKNKVIEDQLIRLDNPRIAKNKTKYDKRQEPKIMCLYERHYKRSN